MNHKKDYYDILGVDEDVPVERIKEAYRRLAFEYHPDRNQGDSAALERMKELNEAYAVLSDTGKRAAYDRMRQTYGTSSAHDQFRQAYSEEDVFRGSDIDRVFEEMARAFGFRGFDEIFQAGYGKGYRTFEMRRPGVFGKFVIFGSPFSMGRRDDAGSLPKGEGIIGKALGYLFTKVFGLSGGGRGRDLYDVITLDPDRAQSGGKVKYLDSRRGRELMITVPPNMREGQRIRLRGMGSPAPGGGAPGDLYLSVNLKKPLLARVRSFLKI